MSYRDSSQMLPKSIQRLVTNGAEPKPLKRRPRQVDFYNRPDDHNCALFGSMGMSTAFIIGKTGLSQSQITYRLKKAGLTKANKASRSDFRNGVSPFSQVVMVTVKQAADRELLKFLRANL